MCFTPHSNSCQMSMCWPYTAEQSQYKLLNGASLIGSTSTMFTWQPYIPKQFLSCNREPSIPKLRMSHKCLIVTLAKLVILCVPLTFFKLWKLEGKRQLSIHYIAWQSTCLVLFVVVAIATSFVYCFYSSILIF